jgi:hypothetical protein
MSEQSVEAAASTQGGGTTSEAGRVPAVLSLLAQLRKEVGVLKAKKKEGVRFNVRSAEELNDRIRGKAIELGILIYPVSAYGKGHVVDDGTLAEVNLTLRIQAVSDGSYIDVQSFGLGADNQDKAGGKANTYAWKSALIQTLLAGGAEDTDDSDAPIKGGVRKKGAKTSVADVTAALLQVKDQASFDAALLMARGLTMDEQRGIADAFKAARARIAAGGN